MAGHSHWSQIKRAKGAADAKRGQLFSRLAREITMSARLGGGDISFNPRLRQAIATAKAESMPADTIERALKKGTGELGPGSIEELNYEGYAPGGVALFIQTATDNKNRTAAEIRAIFTKHNGNMATPGSVAWIFKHRGLIPVSAEGVTEDDVMALALDAGADDVRPREGGGFDVVTGPTSLYAVEEALRKGKLPVQPGKFVFEPENFTSIKEAKLAEAALRMIDALDEHDDVQNVYSNIELSPELMSELDA